MKRDLEEYLKEYDRLVEEYHSNHEDDWPGEFYAHELKEIGKRGQNSFDLMHDALRYGFIAGMKYAQGR